MYYRPSTAGWDDDAALPAADRALTRLLENLFSNAVEHGGSVTVTVAALPDGFVVAGNGPGNPPDERERVFDPGYTTKAVGTGFGLASVSRSPSPTAGTCGPP